MKQHVSPATGRLTAMTARLAACCAALVLAACSVTQQEPDTLTLGDMLATANVERIDGGITFRNFAWAGPQRCAYYGYGPAFGPAFGNCFNSAYFYPYFDLYTFYGWRPHYAWGRYGYGGFWYPHPWYARVYHPGYAHPVSPAAPAPLPAPGPVDEELPGLVPVTGRFQIVEPVLRSGPGGPVWAISPTRGPAPVSSLGGSGPSSGVFGSSGASSVSPLGSQERQRSAGTKKQPDISRTGRINLGNTGSRSRPVTRSTQPSRPSVRAPSPSSRSYSRPSTRSARPAPRVRSSRPVRPGGAARIPSRPEP